MTQNAIVCFVNFANFANLRNFETNRQKISTCDDGDDEWLPLLTGAEHLDRFERGIRIAGIRETSKFEDSTEDQLAQAYDSFLDQFETSDGHSIKAGKEEHVALEDEDVEQEQIVKQKRG